MLEFDSVEMMNMSLVIIIPLSREKGMLLVYVQAANSAWQVKWKVSECSGGFREVAEWKEGGLLLVLMVWSCVQCECLSKWVMPFLYPVQYQSCQLCSYSTYLSLAGTALVPVQISERHRTSDLVQSLSSHI